MLTTLLAITLLAPQAPAQETMTLAGRQVPVTFPAPTPTNPPPGFLEWKGWAFGDAKPSVGDDGFETDTDFRPFSDAKPNADAKPWRMKIVIFTASDVLDRYPDGMVRQRRGYVGDSDLDQVLASIARYRAVLASRTNGKLRFEPDVTIEREFIRAEENEQNGQPEDTGDIVTWVKANVNGGTYQAEDNTYRGPYNGVAVFAAGPSRNSLGGLSPAHHGWANPINGTPVFVYHLPTAVLPGEVESALDDVVLKSLSERLKALGYQGGQMGSQVFEPADVSSLDDPTARQIADSRGKEARVKFANPSMADTPPRSWCSPFTQLTLVSDAEHGTVLQYKELSKQRSGGFFLPRTLDRRGKGNLVVTVRSKNTAPLMVFVRGEDEQKQTKFVFAALGRDLLAPPGKVVPSPVLTPTAFVPDGTWQKVGIDLSSMRSVVDISIQPTFNSLLAEKNDPNPVEYDFADFRFTDDPAPAVAQTSDPEVADAMKAVEAMKAGTATPELATLLSSKSDLVLLNVLNAYTVVKDPTVVRRDAPMPPIDPKAKILPPIPPPLPSLETAIASLSPRRQEFALRAIANQDTAEGWSFIRRQALIGASDIAKGTAIELIAKKDAAGNIDLISTLVDNPGRYAKLKAIEALSTVNTNSAKVMLGTFIFHTDPMIKLAVTEKIGPTDNALLDKAMWSAINEPSDAVRLLSLEKLVQAKGENYRVEGYKGVRDDSVWVRQAFVEWLGKNPSEAHLTALKLALADTSFRVRTAALEALAAQPGAIKAEDVEALKSDPYPQVQEAYAKLAKAKGF